MQPVHQLLGISPEIKAWFSACRRDWGAISQSSLINSYGMPGGPGLLWLGSEEISLEISKQVNGVLKMGSVW